MFSVNIGVFKTLTINNIITWL